MTGSTYLKLDRSYAPHQVPTRTLKLISRFVLVAVIVYSINHSSVMVIVSSELPSGGQEGIKIYRSRHYRNLKVQPFCSTHAQCSGIAGYLIPRCRWFNQVSIMIFVPLHDLLYSTRFFCRVLLSEYPPVGSSGSIPRAYLSYVHLLNAHHIRFSRSNRPRGIKFPPNLY